MTIYCPFCGKLFDNSDCLARHIDECTVNKGNWCKAECQLCNVNTRLHLFIDHIDDLVDKGGQEALNEHFFVELMRAL